MSFVCSPLKGVTEACFTAGVLMKDVTARISLHLRRQEAHAVIFQHLRFRLLLQTASTCKFIET